MPALPVFSYSIRNNVTFKNVGPQLSPTVETNPSSEYDIEIGPIANDVFTGPNSKRLYMSCVNKADVFEFGSMIVYKLFQSSPHSPIIKTQIITKDDFNDEGDILIHDYADSRVSVKYKVVITQNFRYFVG